MNFIEEQIDTLDASVFTGDGFHSKENRILLTEHMARWTREMDRLAQLEEVCLNDCMGCEDNFYNGHNDLGVDGCWSFCSAEMVDRVRVSIDDRPPWAKKVERKPNCYNRRCYIYVSPDSPSVDQTQ